VIRNLADNAVRAARSKVRFTLAEHAGTATVVVEDDGEGIPESERARVFERSSGWTRAGTAAAVVPGSASRLSGRWSAATVALWT